MIGEKLYSEREGTKRIFDDPGGNWTWKKAPEFGALACEVLFCGKRWAIAMNEAMAMIMVAGLNRDEVGDP